MEIFKIEEGIWEGRVRKDASKENLGSHYRSQGDIQIQKRKNLPFVKE